MVKLKGKRELFVGTPLLFSGNPGRVDPSHVANGFVAQALGEGAGGKLALTWMHAQNEDALKSLTDAGVFDGDRAAFRRVLRVAILDPDHCTFPSRGSPFPIHPAFATKDPSDDGYGRMLWRLVCAYYDDPTAELRSFLTSAATDPVSRLARLLAKHANHDPVDGASGYLAEADWEWHAAGDLAQEFGSTLADLIVASFQEDGNGLPSVTIPRFVATLYFAAYLGALRSPTLIASKPSRWEDLPPMFVFGGVPPGDHRGWPERLAAKSFQSVVAAHREALDGILTRCLNSRMKRLPTSAKGRQRNRLLFQAVFTGARKNVIEAATDAAGSARNIEILVQRLLDGVYPYGHLERGARQFGRKLGFAGPERGAGAPRFMLETPTVGLLVDLTLRPGEDLTFDEWLERVYQRFGIVIGWANGLDAVSLLADLGAHGLLHQALDQNRELLRARMVRAGLAVEYSDGETEVVRPDIGEPP